MAKFKKAPKVITLNYPAIHTAIRSWARYQKKVGK